MADTRDVVAYICKEYPHKDELSKARITKLVYLVDWEAAKLSGEPLTTITWLFHNYGPYVDDVINSIKDDDNFVIDSTHNMYGEPKTLINVKDDEVSVNLSKTEMETIDKVISDTKQMFWNDFIDHVYSTYPIKSSDRYTKLDLERLAKEYKLKNLSLVM